MTNIRDTASIALAIFLWCVLLYGVIRGMQWLLR